MWFNVYFSKLMYFFSIFLLVFWKPLKNLRMPKSLSHSLYDNLLNNFYRTKRIQFPKSKRIFYQNCSEFEHFAWQLIIMILGMNKNKKPFLSVHPLSDCFSVFLFFLEYVANYESKSPLVEKIYIKTLELTKSKLPKCE